jgi:hypothetical protein
MDERYAQAGGGGEAHTMPFLSSLRISVASLMLQSPPTPTTPYHPTPQHYTLPLS